jgi:hypothetical protein
VPRKAQVIVGPEHDHALAVKDNFRSFVGIERHEERIEAKSLGLLYQFKAAGFREDVPVVGIIVAVESESIDGYGRGYKVVVGEGPGV